MAHAPHPAPVAVDASPSPRAAHDAAASTAALAAAAPSAHAAAPLSVDGTLTAAASAPAPAPSPPPTPLTKGQKKREKERLEREKTAAAAAAAAAAAGGDGATAAATLVSSTSNGSLHNVPNPRKAPAAATAPHADRPRTDREPRQTKQQQPPQPSHPSHLSLPDSDHPAPRPPRSTKGPRAKHERHASTGSNSSNASSNAAGPASTSAGAAAGGRGGYARGMPSQHAAVTAQANNGAGGHANAHAGSFPAVASSASSSASAASSSAAVAAPAPAAAVPSKLPFHDPPSLFRFHSQRTPSLTVSSAGLVALEGGGSPVPPFYAPVNLLRLMRALTPKLRASDAGFTLGQLWSFYDNPYGHDIDVLLDSNLLLHPHAPPTQPGYTLEGTEVYYVSHLSALVLYERSASESDPSAPPLLSWFECVSPHQRMPLMDSISAIASCFSPPPASPLYDLFKPYPSSRILHQLHSSQLDLTRSWMAITWYPILHDPLSSPFLTGSFLMYHAMQYDANSSSSSSKSSKSKQRGVATIQPRICPLQEARSWGPPQAPSAAAADVSSTQSVSLPAPPSARSRTRALLSSLSASSDVDGGTTAGEEEVVEEAGDDADGETDDEEQHTPQSGQMHSAAVSSAESKSPEISGVSTTPLRRHRSHTGHGKLPSFPAHLCPHCGDRHGPPLPPVDSAVAVPPSPSSSPLSYLPVLGYLCHRVLPSTWFVQAFQPAPPVQQNAAAAAAATLAAAYGTTDMQTASVSASSPLCPPLPSPLLRVPPPAVSLDAVASFNAHLHTPAAFAHLTLAQPARLTHVDLSRPMLSVLQSPEAQHPDLMHMTGTAAMPAHV